VLSKSSQPSRIAEADHCSPCETRPARLWERVRRDAEAYKAEGGRCQSQADPVAIIAACESSPVETVYSLYEPDRSNLRECMTVLERAFSVAYDERKRVGAPSLSFECAVAVVVDFLRVRKSLGASVPTRKVCRYMKEVQPFKKRYSDIKLDALRKRVEKSLRDAEVVQVAEQRLATMSPLTADSSFLRCINLDHVFLDVGVDEPRWKLLRSILSKSLRHLAGAAATVRASFQRGVKCKERKVSHF
jgi:hypothetical protein